MTVMNVPTVTVLEVPEETVVNIRIKIVMEMSEGKGLFQK